MITLREATEVVTLMKNEFDSHDFILVYACAFTLSYLRILWRYDGNAQKADAQIAKAVSRMSEKLNISKGITINSVNIKGKVSSCTTWSKIL